MSNRSIDLLRNESESKWAAEKAIIGLLGKVKSKVRGTINRSENRNEHKV